MMMGVSLGLKAVLSNLELLVLQVIRIVWNAWRSFVPQIQDKRQAKGRAAAHWQRRALILSFAWWHEYAAVINSQRQQLAEALMRWDTRRLSLALEGWHTLIRHKQRRQEQLVQVCVCVACALCWQGGNPTRPQRGRWHVAHFHVYAGCVVQQHSGSILQLCFECMVLQHLPFNMQH